MHSLNAKRQDNNNRVQQLSTTKSSKSLTLLYDSGNSKLAIVLFPCAGGNAASFTAIISEFRNRKEPVAVYLVPWGCDYGNVTELLCGIHIPLRFYSHCAGSVLAMKILERLVSIDRYIAGASIPPENIHGSWSTVSDKTLLSLLYRAGLPELPKAEESTMVPQFRENTDEFFDYFCQKKEPLPINMSLVLSRLDPFTSNYFQAKQLWEKYVGQVTEIRYIDESSHYFLTTQAKTIVDLLMEENK